jgi:hypothetical protein
MFPVMPIRTSLWRAGGVLLAVGLITSLVGASIDRLTSPGFQLAPPSDGQSWLVLAIVCTSMLWSGWIHANGKWAKWRAGALARSVTVAQTPSTRVRWSWTRMQAVVGVFCLVAGIGLASLMAATVSEAFRLMNIVALAPGTLGVSYLLLPRRVRKLEQGRDVVCFWQRQPGINNFERVGVFTVPVYAVLR